MNCINLHAKPTAFLAPLLFILALIACALAYAPGLTGSLHFDDPHNLGGLAQVQDLTSALDFATLGNAGPLGRPLSLLSFAAQAYAWPTAPDVFLYTNICLHLLNGCLLIAMLLLLGRANKAISRQSAYLAIIAGTLWLLLPIHVSSTLMIVQRMNLLAGTFTLLGICAYLYCRQGIYQRPTLALFGMTASIGLGTILAALSKENGALLPTLILVTELTLLNRPANITRKAWLTWGGLILLPPTLLIAGYLAMRLDYNDATVAMRGYTVGERILTQAHILWQYLFNSFIPTPGLIGPFHDDQTLYRNWLAPLSLIATGSWILIITAAIFLRRKAPLFSFAVMWYLVGHSLESTSIPLELYFEHRNYLPLIGPVYAITAGFFQLPARLKSFISLGISGYLLLLALVLHSMTTTWGNPPLAAEMWAINKPDSPRALSYLVEHLQKDGYHSAALRSLKRFIAEHPEAGGTRLQALALSCTVHPGGASKEQVATLEEQLKRNRFQHGMIEQLEIIRGLIKDGRCPSLQPQAIYRLTSKLAENPNYQANNVTHHNLHILMAMSGFDTKDLALTMHHLEQALAIYFNLDTLVLITKTLESAGLTQQAQEFLQQADAHRPSNPLQARTWDRQLAALHSRQLPASTHDNAPYPAEPDEDE